MKQGAEDSDVHDSLRMQGMRFVLCRIVIAPQWHQQDIRIKAAILSFG
jgi:hypothetical protein